MRTDPHYPSSAELAAFRRAVGPAWSLIFADAGHDGAPLGAFDFERTEGIGWSAGHPWPLLDGRPAHVNARAEASSARSRAFARMTGEA